jgi:hypothetical protein
MGSMRSFLFSFIISIFFNALASHALEALALIAPFGDEAAFASLRLSTMMRLLSPIGDLSALTLLVFGLAFGVCCLGS